MKTLLILAFAAIAYADERVATVLLRPDPKFAEKNVSGILKFVQADDNSPVIITGTIKGLKDSGSHGFHVHAKGDITGGCSSTGPHFNPKGVQHGAPTDAVRHVGDLGNIVANSNGEANINITDKIISLSGSNGIIGRAIVVHSGTDDLGKGGNATSLETGNAGDRWACGVIGVA